MNLNQMPQKFQDALETIVEKCREDKTFQNELLANPIQALEKMTGNTVPTYGMKFVAVDQSDPSTLYINIPTDMDAHELTEEQLELVAGGDSFIGCTTVNTTVYVVHNQKR